MNNKIMSQLLKFQLIQNVICKLSNDTLLLHVLKSDIILLRLWYKSHTLLIPFLSWMSEEMKLPKCLSLFTTVIG